MMRHADKTIAKHLPEPADGTVLVVDLGGGEWTVIRRDDAEARRWDAHELDRWFDGDQGSEPMGLAQHLRHAEAVYELGDQILEFGGDDEVLP